VPSTSIVTFTWEVKGRPEGGSDQGRVTQRNSTGVDNEYETSAGVGIANAAPLVLSTNTRYTLIKPPSTCHAPLRLAGSTAESGIPLSSQGASVVCLVPSGTTTGSAYLYTTATTAIQGIRVIEL
jgi:hypothetical protein